MFNINDIQCDAMRTNPDVLTPIILSTNGGQHHAPISDGTLMTKDANVASADRSSCTFVDGCPAIDVTLFIITRSSFFDVYSLINGCWADMAVTISAAVIISVAKVAMLTNKSACIYIIQPKINFKVFFFG